MNTIAIKKTKLCSNYFKGGSKQQIALKHVIKIIDIA